MITNLVKNGLFFSFCNEIGNVEHAVRHSCYAVTRGIHGTSAVSSHLKYDHLTGVEGWHGIGFELCTNSEASVSKMHPNLSPSHTQIHHQ